MGGVLPREGSAPGAPGPPKLPLDEPFVAYSLDERAADACVVCVEPHSVRVRLIGIVLEFEQN